MAEMRDLTDDSFAEEILQSEQPAIVDFWGDHCPACRQIAPILSELAEEYAGRVKIMKLHAAENMATSSQYGIRSMPTVLGFAGGKVLGQLQGARPRDEFVELIERLLEA